MSFIEPNIEIILTHLNQLNASKKPLWGTMNAQRMVEHLTDLLLISIDNKLNLLIKEEEIPKMQHLLESDRTMPKELEVPFADKNTPLRNDELDLAIDEMVETFLLFEEFFEKNPSTRTLHPYYGKLNFSQWKRLHSKHITHHFEQFGLI